MNSYSRQWTVLALAGCLTAWGPAWTANAAVRETVTAGYWTNAATWKDGLIPAEGDQVVIHHAVTLDEPTPILAGFTNNATLTFHGWETRLSATDVTIHALVTHPAQSDTNGTPGVYEDWEPDHRVRIECSNLTVTAQGTINVNGKGYISRRDTYYVGCGPGGGAAGTVSHRGGGGGYGGSGGTYMNTVGGRMYGSVMAPTDPGSGGGGQTPGSPPGGGWGGGAVLIQADGNVIVNGNISAHGTRNSQFAAGGSGGSVFITCRAITGTNGVISVEGHGGGGGRGSLNDGAASGGGGRIAIIYDTTAQSNMNLVSPPMLQLSAAGGVFSDALLPYRGTPGTVYVPDTSFYPPETMTDGAHLAAGSGEMSWNTGEWIVDNTWVIAGPGFNITTTNDVQVSGLRGRLDVGDGTDWAAVRCGRNLIVTNAAQLHLRSATTNGSMEIGALLQVSRELAVGTDATVYFHSNPTNGGSAKIETRHLAVAAGGMLNAVGLGFQGGIGGVHEYGWGPGGGAGWSAANRHRGGGGGFGGKGGHSHYNNPGGDPYGEAAAVVQCGSGGGANDNDPGPKRRGAAGGGLIRIDVARNVRIDGTINAGGRNGGGTGVGAGSMPYNYAGGGGGSGGGIYLRCRRFTGSGTLLANGGNGHYFNGQWSGGGGGGRIAVWCTYDEWTGTLSWPDSVAGGTAAVTFDGMPGSIYRGHIPPLGSLLIVR